VKTARGNLPIAHDDRANRRVRARLAKAAPSFAQGRAHKSFVVHADGLSLALAHLNPELRAVSLSLREKQSLYHSLGQLLRSGVPLAGALKSLAQTSSGGQRRLIRRLNEAINAGKTMGEAIAAQRPEVSDLEIGVITACEKSGRLEAGMTQLAGYHGAFATARDAILKKCAYPVFVLHFGIFLFPLKTLIVGGGVAAYLRETFGVLALIYAVVLVVFLLLPLLRDAGSKSAVFDSLIRMIPMIGKIRRAFATSRFCATYGMQLGAGINVIDALQAAQRASLSGLITAAIRRAIPEVRNGAQVGPLLAVSGAFPPPMTRALIVGEQTGELDEELTRMTAEYQEEALARLDTAAEWVPRLLYVGILIYVGYSVVRMYQGYLVDLGKIIDG
jgi:type II secretory pathway component PulF